LPDSWNVFWERLIVDCVAVLVFAFLAQGIWFLGVDLLTRASPGLDASLIRASSRIGVPWVLAILGGVGWAAWRAWRLGQEVPRR
jgi:hypothetical protein